MVDGSGGIDREIPVDKAERVKDISTSIRALLGRSRYEAFRVGEPEDYTTLSIDRVPIAPWRRRRDQREDLSVGNSLYIDLEQAESVLNDEGAMATRLTTTFYELDQRYGKRSVLRSAGTHTHLTSEEGSGRSHPKFYEDEATAQEIELLSDALARTDKSKRLQDDLGLETQTEQVANREIRRKLEAESQRIFEAAGDNLRQGRSDKLANEIEFVVDDRLIILSQYLGDEIRISIETNSGDPQTPTHVETFYSDSDPVSPLGYNTDFEGNHREGSSPIVDADEDQTAYLLALLESAKDAELREQAMVRRIILDETDRIFDLKDSPPHEGDEDLNTVFNLKDATISVNRSIEDGYPSVSVHVEDRVTYEGEDTGGTRISRQAYFSEQGSPLMVTTHAFGEESGDGTTRAADEGQRRYITTLMQEFPLKSN